MIDKNTIEEQAKTYAGSNYKKLHNPKSYNDSVNGFRSGAEWVIEQLQPKWIPINERPDVKSELFIGINKGLEYPSPMLVGYHHEYKPTWTDYYTEEEAFITHYIQAPKDQEYG